MNTDISSGKDIRTPKVTSGAYEWWYFDAISDDRSIKIVIIFYEGNPFSRRYISEQQNGAEATAGDFPAISISVYKNEQPLYYSFTEVDPTDASFKDDKPYAAIGKHLMAGSFENDRQVYSIRLKEKLPSGDAIVGDLTFVSPRTEQQLFEENSHLNRNHTWNLMQPRARVDGTIRCFARNESSETINFTGRGYHDHNVGKEPLKNEFDDWYWGRFHFQEATLVYYIMEGRPQEQFGWLIGRDNNRIGTEFNAIELQDSGNSLYGLSSARKILLISDDTNVLVQQRSLLDNGPFYQRFSSEAFLNANANDTAQSASGITEYLCPPRIYNRLYWPLTNMRIRYQKEKPHWVQKSKKMYRWTW